jgi:hypothetical protein
LNYAIGKQKCAKCGRFRSIESPEDLSVGLVGNGWRCKHCEPGGPSTPEERDNYKKMMADPRRVHADKED